MSPAPTWLSIRTLFKLSLTMLTSPDAPHILLNFPKYLERKFLTTEIVFNRGQTPTC